MKWLDGIPDSKDMSLSKFREIGKDREDWRACGPCGRREPDTTEQLNNRGRIATQIYLQYYMENDKS